MGITILVGASGSGKSSIGHKLEKLGIPPLVSFTTRGMREGEKHGVDYFFMTREEVESTDPDEILEIAEYNGDYYGLFFSEVKNKLKKYPNVYFIAARDGAKQLSDIYPEDTHTIWLRITIEEMVKRMRIRGDNEENILSRVENAIDTGELYEPEELKPTIVDATRGEDEVFSEVLDVIKSKYDRLGKYSAGGVVNEK